MSSATDATTTGPTVTINVAGNHLMTGLLGERDEFLRVVEARFPTTNIHARGNVVTVTGEQAVAAGEVIGHFGARPEADLAALMAARGL